MGMMYSKSCVAIASFVVTLTAISCYVDGALPSRSFYSSTTAFVQKTKRFSSPSSLIVDIRGGDDVTITDDYIATSTETAPMKEEKSLDEKVYAAMEKLGLSPPSTDGNDNDDAIDDTADDIECNDGVCPVPKKKEESEQEQVKIQANPNEMADRLAKEMNVDSRLTMAAIGATSTIGGNGNEEQRVFNESAARLMIQQELDLIDSIQIDSEDVQALTEEGYDEFLSRRALAFAESNLEDARAILMADQMDADEEEAEEAAARAEAEASTSSAVEEESDFVEVKSNFDPTKLPATQSATTTTSSNSSNENDKMPKPANREDVIFEATTAQIQELVLESPVPVLLDIYADW
jgi:hypothetical protein